MVNEGEGGVATFNGKKVKGKGEKINRMESRRSKAKGDKGTHKKRGLILYTVEVLPKRDTVQTEVSIDLRGAVYGAWNVNQRAFRSGAHLWRRPTMLG